MKKTKTVKKKVVELILKDGSSHCIDLKEYATVEDIVEFIDNSKWIYNDNYAIRANSIIALSVYETKEEKINVDKN